MSIKTPSAVKKFKEFCKRFDGETEFHLMDEDLVRESDRSLIILQACRIEDGLDFKIRGAMPVLNAALEEDLFGDMKPLSSFSAKINLACAMGMYKKEYLKQLHAIRVMRNEAAHLRKHLSFDIIELRECSWYATPQALIKYFQDPPNDGEKARDHFLSITSFYAHLLFTGEDETLEAARVFFEKG